VRDQIMQLVDLGGLLHDGDIKRASWQVASCGAGSRWLHSSHSTRLSLPSGPCDRRDSSRATNRRFHEDQQRAVSSDG
jgi:hypothetical protein